MTRTTAKDITSVYEDVVTSMYFPFLAITSYAPGHAEAAGGAERGR